MSFIGDHNQQRGHGEYLRRCYEAAALSPDPSNQNGSLLVAHSGWESGGLNNNFPQGVDVTLERLQDREWKLFHIEHAERQSLFAAARAGVSTWGSTLYCPWFACSDCARAIVLCGVTRVVGHQQRMDMTPDRWKASVEAGLNLMRAAGVVLEFFDGDVGGIKIIVNGEPWQP